MELDRLFYTLGIKMDGFDADIKKAETQFGGLVQAATKAAAAIGFMFRFKQVIEGIDTLGDTFQHNMGQVKGIASITEKQFDSLRKKILELSLDAEKGSHDILKMTKALYQTISAGVQAGNSIEFMGKAMKAATAGDADLKVVVDGLTNIMNGWGLSMTELDSVIDKVFYTIEKGKTNFTEIASNIGDIASNADTANVSLDDILSGIALLTKKGIETNRAVTYMNAALSGIIDPADQASEAADRLGIDFSAAALSTKGFVGILNEIKEKTGGSATAISSLFTSLEAQKGVSALIGGKSLIELNSLVSSMSGDLSTLKSELTETWQVNIFDNVEGQSDTAATSIEKVGNASDDAWKAFKAFYDESKLLAEEGGMDTSDFVSSINEIEDAAGTAGTSFGKISASLWAVASVVGLPVSTIVNAILGIDEGIDGVTLQKIDDELEAAGKSGNAVKKQIVTAFTSLKNNKDINFDTVLAAFDLVIEKAEETTTPITKIIDELNALDGKNVTVDFSTVQNNVENLSGAIDEPVENILNAITGLANLGTENGMDFSTVWEAINDLEEKSGKSLSEIKEAIQKVDEDPNDTDFNWVYTALESTAYDFGVEVSAMKTMLESIDDEGNFNFMSIVEKLSGLSTPLQTAVIELGKIIQPLGGEVDFTGLVTALGKLPQDETFQGNVEKIREAIEAVNSAGTGLTFPNVAEAISNIATNTDKSIEEVVKAVKLADKPVDGFNYNWINDALAVEATTMNTTVENLRKSIATLDDDELDFSSVVALFANRDTKLQTYLDSLAANADTIVSTSKDYGTSVADIIENIETLAAEGEGATGKAEKALQDMLTTMDEKEQAIQNKMNNLSVLIHDNMLGLKNTILDVKGHMIDWAGQLDGNDFASIGAGLAMMVTPAILSGLGKLIGLIKGAMTGMSGWAGILQLVGFAVTGVSALISILNVETQTTNDEIERMDKALEELGTLSFENVVRKSEETDSNLRNMIQHTKELMSGAEDLVVAVEAYNTANQDGGTELSLLQDQIDGILTTHESLKSVVIETNSGYEIQYEQLSKIYKLEMSRIRAAQAERLASIQDEKKTINEYETVKKQQDAMRARMGDLKAFQAAYNEYLSIWENEDSTSKQQDKAFEQFGEKLKYFVDLFGDEYPEFADNVDKFLRKIDRMDTNEYFFNFDEEANLAISKFDEVEQRLSNLYAGYEMAKANTDYDALSVITSFKEISELEQQLLVSQIKAIQQMETDQEKRDAQIEKVVNQYNTNLNKNSASALKLLPTAYKEQLSSVLNEMMITADNATEKAAEYITTATQNAEVKRLEALKQQINKDIVEQNQSINKASKQISFLSQDDESALELRANAYAGIASQIENIREALYAIRMDGMDLGDDVMEVLLSSSIESLERLDKTAFELGQTLTSEVLGTLESIMNKADSISISDVTDSDSLRQSHYELNELYKQITELSRQSFVIDLENEDLNKRIDESKKKLEESMKEIRDSLYNTEASKPFESTAASDDFILNYTEKYFGKFQEKFKEYSNGFVDEFGSEVEDTMQNLLNLLLDNSASMGEVNPEINLGEFSLNIAGLTKDEITAELEKIKNIAENEVLKSGFPMEISAPFIDFTDSGSAIQQQVDLYLGRINRVLKTTLNQRANNPFNTVESDSRPSWIEDGGLGVGDIIDSITFKELDKLKEQWNKFIEIGTDEKESFGLRADAMGTLAMLIGQVEAGFRKSAENYDPKKAYNYEMLGEVIQQYQEYLERMKAVKAATEDLSDTSDGTAERVQALEQLKSAQESAGQAMKNVISAMSELSSESSFDLSGINLNPEVLQEQIVSIEHKLDDSLAQIDVAKLNSKWKQVQENIFNVPSDELLADLNSLKNEYQSLFEEWDLNGIFEINPELRTQMLSDLGVLTNNIALLEQQVEAIDYSEKMQRNTQSIRDNISSLEKQIEFINRTGLSAESLESRINQLASAYLSLALNGELAAESMTPEELQQAKDAYTAISQVIESFDMRVPLPDNIDQLITQYPFLQEIVESIKNTRQENVSAIEDEIQKEERVLELYQEMDGEGELYTSTLRKIISLYKQWLEAAILSGTVSKEQINQIRAALSGLEGQLENVTTQSQPDTFWSDFEASFAGEKKLLDYFQSTGDMDRYKGQLTSVISTLQRTQEEIIKRYGTENSMLSEVNSLLEEYQGINVDIEAQEEAKEKALEKQKQQLEAQAKFMNTIVSSIASELKQFGSLGSLIGGILDNFKFSVEEMEDGSHALVSPFENMEELSANIGASIASWAISEIGKQIQGILESLKKIDELTALDKWDMGTTKLAETLKNFKEFEQNQAILNSLKGQRIGAGILDFFTFGFLGLGQKIDDQISEIEQKLKSTASAVATALGIGVEDLSSSLENAFMNSDSYESFVANFSESLETMTKQALIRAFISSEVVQGAFKGLSELFVQLYEDGNFSASDIEMLKNASSDLKDQLQPWWDAIQEILGDFGGGDEWSESSAVKDTIKEDTANRLAALLSTINLNVANINDILSHKSIAVRVINIEEIGGLSAGEYLRALGG